MIRNYFKIAFRNLWKHRVFSLINILGLTVGLTACFLIFLYVHFEWSYDSFHSKSNRIYRLVCDIKTPSEVIKANGPSWAVPPNIINEFPEVESMVRLAERSLLVRKGDIKFQEESAVFADSSFFHVFDFKLLQGNPQTALKDPFSIVFTETTAKKYFGEANPMGQTLLLTGNNLPVKVTGIMKDIPVNSQIQTDLLVSMTTLTQKLNPRLDEQWGNYGSSAFLLLRQGTKVKALEAKFPAFLESRNGEEMKKSKMFVTLFLEPLRDVYLYSTRDDNKNGNIKNVFIFSCVAIFILLIACFNFINLTTARSAERAKEVGIRKVVGALRMQLATQFIGESILLCLIAFILTILFAALFLPVFNQLSGKIISNGILKHLPFIFILFLSSVGVGVLAGLYPALVLSSFKPTTVLKGRFATGTIGVILRKALVIAQFTISIGLIICTMVVYKQMNFMRTQDLGFSKNQILVVDTKGDPGKTAFQESVKAIPGVLSSSQSSSVPGGDNPGAYSEIENNKGEFQVANLDLYFVDWDYINQYKIKMVAGRPFSRTFQSDTTQAMIINESAAKMFGYGSSAQAVGRRFKQWGREGTIVGVMKDFHFRSLEEMIKPLTMRIEPDGCSLVSITLSASHLPSTIAAIENKWKIIVPARPFSYFFVDEFFDKQYRSEERFGKLFLYFAILAIFISCLGLLGLASYSTLQRTKEIGIRKVMGASVSNIVTLLSKDFLILVLISFVLAAPITGEFMHRWLQDFAYRTAIGWWIFVMACMLAVLVALLTISFQAIKAAVTNPVNSLKTE